jgi:hypothetical protein
MNVTFLKVGSGGGGAPIDGGGGILFGRIGSAGFTGGRRNKFSFEETGSTDGGGGKIDGIGGAGSIGGGG